MVIRTLVAVVLVGMTGFSAPSEQSQVQPILDKFDKEMTVAEFRKLLAPKVTFVEFEKLSGERTAGFFKWAHGLSRDGASYECSSFNVHTEDDLSLEIWLLELKDLHGTKAKSKSRSWKFMNQPTEFVPVPVSRYEVKDTAHESVAVSFVMVNGKFKISAMYLGRDST